MTAEALRSALNALPQLNPIEIQFLEAAIHRGSSQGPATEEEEDTFTVFCKLMAAHGIRQNFSYSEIGRQKCSRAWKTGVENLNLFISYAFKDAIKSKVERLALINFLFDLLLTDLRGRHVPITIKTVTHNMTRITGLFSDAFPGYVEAGMAYVVLLALNGNAK
jgi:hypothetical protein